MLSHDCLSALCVFLIMDTFCHLSCHAAWAGLYYLHRVWQHYHNLAVLLTISGIDY